MRYGIKVSTKRGIELDGVVFESGKKDCVVIAITGIHGNFYSNPMYYNIGETLSRAGVTFVYAQTNDAFSQIETFNHRTNRKEIIGSFNEDLRDTIDDVGSYIDWADRNGYHRIILAGHSLGGNKVIFYLAETGDRRISHYILISPANLRYMLQGVSMEEREIIRQYMESGYSGRMLPFEFMGWAPMIARTANQWLYDNPLDNVHSSDADGSFNDVHRIVQTGAIIIGSYDRFSYGDPYDFARLINSHTLHPELNKLVFVEGTGHVYTKKEQYLADKILNLVKDWD